jgi:hypothetical protein
LGGRRCVARLGGGSLLGSPTLTGLADYCQRGADRDGFAFPDQEFEHDPLSGRGDFRIHFVGRDLDQHLV